MFGVIAVAGLAAAQPKPWTHLNYQNDPDEFQFAIVPDRTGGDYRGAFTNALAKVNMMHPEFVMTVGDLIQGANKLEEMRAQQTELTNMTAKVVAPFFTVVGNHDISRSRFYPPGYETVNEDNLKVWEEYYGKETYYSFVYKNVLFVCLNTMEGRGIRPYSDQVGITKKQYDWFKRTLDEHDGVRWTCIFMHQPAEWLTDAWLKFEKDELSKRPYTVFAGDWHTYLHVKRHGRDYYVLAVAGGCSGSNTFGAPEERAKLAGMEYGEVDHITWVTMTKDKGPAVVNLTLDGILPGDFRSQTDTLWAQRTEPLDYPVDPKVSERLRKLGEERAKKRAALRKTRTVNLRTARVLCCDTNDTDSVVAAEELEKHLKLVAGERAPAADGFEFVVGVKPGIGQTPGTFESCARVCGNAIFFWGDTEEHGLERSRGPLFAVYEFLDRKLGVKWVFPGDDGIVYKPLTTVEVVDDEMWSFTPPLPEVCSFRCYRSFRKIRRIPMPKAFRISERDFSKKCDDIEQWYGRMRLASKNRQASGHAFKSWQKRFLKDHPEWFAYVEHPELVRDGKPGRGVVDSQSGRVHGCYSCPTLPQAIVDDWVASGAPKRFNICLNDGGYCFCLCPNCLALDTRLPGEDFRDHLTDRVLHLYNGIMPLALKVRPDVDVCAYIYASYRKPPRREKVLYGDHMLFSWVPGLGDDYLAELKAWLDAGVKRFYMRPNFMCYDGVFPRGLERHLFDNFKSCMAQPGAVGVMYDGTPRPITDLEYYVICSLAQRPDRGFDELMEEFYSQYGAAAPEAKAYFEHVRARAGEILAVANGSKMPQLKQRLDDSELGKFAYAGHTLADLEAELALLRPGLVKQLAPQDRVRFSRLALRAENAILTFRFLAAAAGKDEVAFQSAADALHAFRVENFAALGREGAAWLSKRNCESAAWNRTKYMSPKGNQPKSEKTK